MPTRRIRATQLALLAILLLAFVLRVHHLGAQSLWYDEAVTAQVAQQGLAELTRWTADDIQPPLYYALMAGWTRLAGVSEWALRFPSLFFGVAAVALACALGRRLFGPPAGLIAALLAAAQPLWLYYSQEARMYTLLTALGMAAGYALLRIVANGSGATVSQNSRDSQFGYTKQRLIWWTAFTLTAIALLYTHYFAVFLLLAYGLFFVFFLTALLTKRSPGAKRLAFEGLCASLIIGLAYLPWLPNLLRRFGQDASYWAGALKLNEALRHLAISFSSGETVLEAQAIPLAWITAGLAALCLAALLWTAASAQLDRQPLGMPTPWWAILFVVLYLAAPVVCILALAYRTPKFNPRYLMLASPAFVLLLAGGLALPFHRPARRAASRGVSRLLALAALAVLLAISLYAARNWFTDPAFTKDDWRGAVANIRSQLQPDEAVILVSGHAYPAWRYYAPDIEPVRLPEIETLDVTAVLDLSVAGQLNTALAGKRGAWLLGWQEEVVDPTGVVPFLLDAAGDALPTSASFWGLGAPRHYRFFDAIRAGPDAPGAFFSSELPLTAASHGQLLGIDFGAQVELLGYSQPPCSQPLCPVYLFWRSLAPLSSDLKLSATLLGRNSTDAWSQPQDRRLAAYDYPTFRWPPGEVVLSKLEVAPFLGAPPGEYRLRLEVYDAAAGQALDILDAAGAAQGRSAWLEPIVVSALVADGPGSPPANSTSLSVAPEIVLHGLSADRAEVEPGDPIGVEAWWQATTSPSLDYSVGWQWVDPAGRTWPGGWAAPAGPAYPTSQWPAQDALVRGRFDILLPNDAQPGNWLLRLGLIETAAGRSDAEFAGATVDLPITVRPSTRRFEPSAPFDYPSGANFDSVVELLGARVAGEKLRAGAILPVTVGWRALQRMDAAYTGFVHLVDADGKLVAQDDHEPLQGQRPTTAWAAGEVIEDTYELRLPADLAPGVYRLEIGLYDGGRPGLPRLETSQGAGSVLLGEIEVTD